MAAARLISSPTILSKVSPDWTEGPGKGTAVKWPAGIGQKGSEGVSGMVRQSPGAFGYVELIYATAEQDSVRRGEECGGQVPEGDAPMA